MTKKVIAIVSVLKPVDDTRNFEKIAVTISNTNKYDINIIGFSTKKIPSYPNITFHPVFSFQRTSFKRIVASIKILKIILKLKPEVIIVTCAELLIVMVLNKILFGYKLIYDIQENYYLNIIYTPTYPAIIRYPLASWVRLIELLTAGWIDHYILAERVYKCQLKFTSGKSVVIENKAIIPEEIKKNVSPKQVRLSFVYAGTISEHYGIFDAIHFIKELKTELDDIQLTIIGYVSLQKSYRRLIKETKDCPYISIIGGDILVPHNQILMEMKKAEFCVLPYQKNKSTEGRIPTKLFECLAMEKPVIITPNPAWDSIIRENNAGIIYDFSSDVRQVLDQLHRKFYGNNLASKNYWEGYSADLLHLMEN